MSAIELSGRLTCANGDEADIVRQHLPQHIELTRAEPGCLRFDVEPTANPLIWTVRERFVDQAAFDAHQSRVRASDWGRVTSGIARDYVVEVVADD